MSDRGAPRGMVPLVLRREITTRVRERSFLISTAVTLIIVAAIVVVPSLFNSGDDNVTVGVVGDAATVQTALHQAAQVHDATLTELFREVVAEPQPETRTEATRDRHELTPSEPESPQAQWGPPGAEPVETRGRVCPRSGR